MALRPSLRMLACALAAATASLASAAASAAHELAPPGGHVPHAVQNALGGDVSVTADDLYKVDPRRGPPLVTHGPDTPFEVRPFHGSSLGPGDPERAPVCATDYYQQVIYARPASVTSRYATVRPAIQATMRRIDAALNEESLASGGATADYKVLCDGAGEVRVDELVVNSGTSFNAVVSAARAAGYDAANVDYTIFFDYTAANVCGVGSFSSDERLVAANANNTGGDYGVSYNDCWNGETTMHENGHNEGAVQYGAPFSTGTGAHCWDENDVMCYSPDGGDLHQQGTINRCTDQLHFDCGNDDYFDSAPESCEYLATHWNLGSRLNRFIAFGAGSSNTPPCANFTAVCATLACSFTDSSSDPEGPIATRSWSFGDGASSSATNPSHTYAAPGTYGVTLTVTDGLGASHSVVRQVVVPGSTPPAEGGGTTPPNPGSPVVDPADAQPPETTITAGPRERTRKRKAVFEFSSSKPGSSFECSLDAEPFGACDSPYEVKAGRGRHSVRVRAIDAFGQVDPTPASAAWRVRR